MYVLIPEVSVFPSFRFQCSKREFAFELLMEKCIGSFESHFLNGIPQHLLIELLKMILSSFCHSVTAGGHFGAVKYAVTFAAAGTALDYAALKLAPEWHAWKEQFSGKKDWFTLPEWSPIQVLDEEALAKKKAREEKLFAQRALGKLDKEDP